MSILQHQGKVYDVSTARQFYGPDGVYPFAGRECARALAKMSTEEKDLVKVNPSELSAAERDTLDQWIGKFDYKYPIIGRVV